MAFLQRPRSLQPFYSVDENEGATYHAPHGAALENIAQKRKRTRTSSSHIISRVSTIFSSRKKDAALPDLALVDSALEHVIPRPSFASFNSTIDSEDDDIRIPSGLGSAATVYSFPVPPSPHYPLQTHYGASPAHSPLSQIYMNNGARALSSPNLLRLSSMRVTLGKKTLSRRPSSISMGMESVYQQPVEDKTTPRSSVVMSPEASCVERSPTPPPPPPPKPPLALPEEIILGVLSHLPISSVTTCATISWDFATAARTLLYSTVNFEALSPVQAEKLVTVLVSRRDLTDLVTRLICRKWPSFFLPDTGRDTIVVTHPNATLLTAAFTLAFERMRNLVTLVLPAFDASLLCRHVPFRLQSLTLLQDAMSDSETQTVFSWLEGQTHITSLYLPNLEDTPSVKPPTTLAPGPSTNGDESRSPRMSPASPYLRPLPQSHSPPSSSPAQSPKLASFSPAISSSAPSSTLDTVFSSSTLLPSLTTLQAPACLITRLTTTAPRRPLRSVSIAIHTTLYNGLRPAALMNALHGVKHLSVRFGDSVDKRSFEKVLGAAGASLGRSPTSAASGGLSGGLQVSSKWCGLESLEVAFENPALGYSGRDEAFYKGLQASLPRYNALSSLRLVILSDDTESSPTAILTAAEQVLLDSWAKLCPTLQTVRLFSGAQWYNKRTRLSLRLPEERMNGFRYPPVN